MVDEKIIKSFKFHVPVELKKADKEEDEAVDSWKIQGIASTDDEDLQGEIVDQDGLDISMLKAGRGLFNEDHKPGIEHVVGQIEDADFVDMEGKKALFVKGYLFKHQEKGKAFYNILKSLKKGSHHRVHFSIEGKILQRSFSDPKNIVKARVNKVALTLDPVNPTTYCSMMKSLNAMCQDANGGEVSEIKLDGEQIIITKEEILKTLAAGVGHANAPTTRTGGEAMQTESLDSKKKNMTYKERMKDMAKSVLLEFHKRHPNVELTDAAKLIGDIIKKKFE